MKRIPKTSERSRLRKEIGALHLKILRLQRGDRCEICQVPFKVPFMDLARFHILTVAAHPRLEFTDDNILIYARTHWYSCHEPYHRDRDSRLGQRIMNRIIELRGPDFREKLLAQENCISKMDKLYLLALRSQLQDELESLKGSGYEDFEGLE